MWRGPIAAQGWGPCGHPFLQGAPQLRSPHPLSLHPILSMTHNTLMETRELPKSRSPRNAAQSGDEEERGGRGERRREGERAAGGGGVDPDLSQELEATASISQSGGRGLRRKGPPWSSWVPGTPHPWRLTVRVGSELQSPTRLSHGLLCFLGCLMNERRTQISEV